MGFFDSNWTFLATFSQFSWFQAYLALFRAYMALCRHFRGFLPYWTYSEGILGVLLGFFGPNLTFLAILSQFGPVFLVLGRIWWYLGLSVGQFGPILWVLGPIWWYLSMDWACKGLFWKFWGFGPIFGVLGPIWRYLSLYWAYIWMIWVVMGFRIYFPTHEHDFMNRARSGMVDQWITEINSKCPLIPINRVPQYYTKK